MTKREIMVGELGFLINSLSEEQLDYVSVIVKTIPMNKKNNLYYYGSDISKMAKAQKCFMGSPAKQQNEMVSLMECIFSGEKVTIG